MFAFFRFIRLIIEIRVFIKTIQRAYFMGNKLFLRLKKS